MDNKITKIKDIRTGEIREIGGSGGGLKLVAESFPNLGFINDGLEYIPLNNPLEENKVYLVELDLSPGNLYDSINKYLFLLKIGTNFTSVSNRNSIALFCDETADYYTKFGNYSIAYAEGVLEYENGAIGLEGSEIEFSYNILVSEHFTNVEVKVYEIGGIVNE
jgi:hypothetical protein